MFSFKVRRSGQQEDPLPHSAPTKQRWQALLLCMGLLFFGNFLILWPVGSMLRLGISEKTAKGYHFEFYGDYAYVPFVYAIVVILGCAWWGMSSKR